MALISALAALQTVACGGDSGSTGDAGPGDAGPEDAGPAGDPADFVFDQAVIRTYELTVDPVDWQWLNDNPVLEEYVPATLRYEGQTFEQVAVRFKGSYGTLRFCFDGQGNLICDKLSLKLKFSEYDPERRFYGLKRLNFHGMESDPTRLKDNIAYALFRESDVYASRTSYARLVVNGELLGLFAAVEQVDGRFTRARFPDGGEGNLYKEIWPLYAVEQPYLDALRTNEDESPSADKMVRFAADLAAADPQTFAATIEAWTDVDMLMRLLAVDRLIDNWDGIVAWYCLGGGCFNHNYYWYEDASQDRVWLIPWDLDNTFQVPSPIRTYYGMPDWDDDSLGCQQLPVFFGINGRPPACDPTIGHLSSVMWDRYAAATQALLDGPFRVDAMNARIDALSTLIRDAVAEDPNGPSVAEWEAAVAQLRADVVALRGYIESKL